MECENAMSPPPFDRRPNVHTPASRRTRLRSGRPSDKPQHTKNIRGPPWQLPPNDPHSAQGLFPLDNSNSSLVYAPSNLAEEPSGIPITPPICEQDTHPYTAEAAILNLHDRQPDATTPNASEIQLSEQDERFIGNESHFSPEQQGEIRPFYKQYYQNNNQRSPLTVEVSDETTKTGKVRDNARVTKAICNFCGKQKPTLQKMARHQKKCLDLKGKYYCKKLQGELPCPRKYRDKQELDRHVRRDHVYRIRKRKPTANQETHSISAGADYASSEGPSWTTTRPKKKKCCQILAPSLPPSKVLGKNGGKSSRKPRPRPAMRKPRHDQRLGSEDPFVGAVYPDDAHHDPLVPEQVPLCGEPSQDRDYVSWVKKQASEDSFIPGYTNGWEF